MVWSGLTLSNSNTFCQLDHHMAVLEKSMAWRPHGIWPPLQRLIAQIADRRFRKQRLSTMTTGESAS